MYQVINNISALSVILPVTTALIFFRRYPFTFKVLAIFFFISGLFDLALVMMVKMGVPNNAPILHLFVLVSVTFLGVFYYQTIFNPWLKKLILIFVPLVMALVIVNGIYIEGIWAFPATSNSAQSLLFILLALLYFYQLLTRQEVVYIEKQGLFWINAGVLIYFTSNVFLFMLYNRLVDAGEWNLWIIHSVTNIIANILYTIGLLCKPQTSTSYQYS